MLVYHFPQREAISQYDSNSDSSCSSTKSEDASGGMNPDETEIDYWLQCLKMMVPEDEAEDFYETEKAEESRVGKECGSRRSQDHG